MRYVGGMARLVHIDAELVRSQRGWMRPPSTGEAAWRATRPRDPGGVEPWFALTPRSPGVDTRVGGSAGPGVAASLETFGGMTGPAFAAALGDGSGVDEVILGGNPVPLGTPAPEHPKAFDRYSCIRIAIYAEGVARGRQCLLVGSMRARGANDLAGIQTFVGRAPVSEDLLRGEERLALLIDVPEDETFILELRWRLCGSDLETTLGFRGVTGYLL